MAMVFKTRHFKRTLFVAAVIGGMWYLYVTKDSKSSNRKDSAFNDESDRPLSLQERMQEVLAAREWLAENSVNLAGYNARGGGGGGGGREEDAYQPNLLFNNHPPPPPALRTYYGSVGGGGDGGGVGVGVDDGRRFQQSEWGNGGLRADNVDLPGLPRPFAGGGGDLNKYMHVVGADEPGYSEVAAQSSGTAEGGGGGGGGGAAGRMPLAAAQPQPGPREAAPFGSSSQSSPAAAVGEKTPNTGGFQRQFQPQFFPDDTRQMNPSGVPPLAWNGQPYPPQQQQPFNSPNGFAPESGVRYPNPSPQYADALPLKYPAYTYPPRPTAGLSGFDRPGANPLETDGDGSAPGRGLNPDPSPPQQRERTAVGLVEALRARAAESDTNPGTRDEPDRQKAPLPSPQDPAGKKRDDSDRGNANPDPTVAEEVRERQGVFVPTFKPHLAPAPPSLPSSASGGRPGETLSTSGLQSDKPAAPDDAALLPPSTPEAEQSQSFVGRILSRLLSPAKDDGKDRPGSEVSGVGSRSSKRGVKAEREEPGAAGKDAPSLARSVRTLESQGHSGGQVGGQDQGRQAGSEPGDTSAGRLPIPARPSSSATSPNGFVQQLQQQQQPRGDPSVDIYLMQQRQQQLQQLLQQRLPGPQFPGQRGQQLLQQQQQQQQLQHQNPAQKGPNPPPAPAPAAASSDDLTTVTMVTRDRTHWKEDECPAKDDSLTQATLSTPFGNVPLYVEKVVDDTAAYNRAFGVQWNMRGIGTFFDRCLLPDPNVTLVDIGAGLGPVSLTAARLGREVFAIEPLDTMAGALCRSVIDFRYNNVRVMHNAVSDERTKVYYRRTGNKNQPTDTYVVDSRDKSKTDHNSPSALAIRLDDMLRLYKVSRVAVRMDLRGMEGRALVGTNKFFNTLDISCILMNWSLVHSLKDFGGSYVFDALTSRGFFPHHVQTLKPLKVFRMHDWPTEVLWAKLGSAPVKL